MEERSRLGRGLEEVTRLYLSDTPRENARGTDPDREGQRQGRVIRVIHPGSALLGAFFTANLSLELLRHGCRVAVHDCASGEEDRVEALFGRALRRDRASGAPRVSLYGLGEIPVYPGGVRDAQALPEDAAPEDAGGRWVLVHAPGCLDEVSPGAAYFEVVLLSGLDWPSVLQCYAWLKVLAQGGMKHPVSLAFVDPSSEAHGLESFSRFSSFVAKRLGISLDYLGGLVSDEILERSITDREPLVLGHEPSAARESLEAVCSAFLGKHGRAPAMSRCRP